MLKNYFKIAWRNLINNKVFSIINISGLALGITCSLLIMLWVHDEYSVDAFHTNGKQLYQIYERQYNDGKVEASYMTQGLLADELKRTIPEVEYASSLEQNFSKTFEASGKVIKMEGSYAGADFFSMFSYKILQGKPQTALNIPGGIAISRKMAELFFGSSESAIGRSIRFENKENLRISAVFENLPVNSSQQFDFLRSWKDYTKENAWVSSWPSTSPATYVQLRKNSDPLKVEAKIKDFIYNYQPKNSRSFLELGLQPYPEKYLYSAFKNGQISGGRIEYVNICSLLAVFILLIACINFMNLATARSIKRAKEVGVRKVIGAGRFSLAFQFIGEAILLTFFSIIIAIILTILILPAFNGLTGKQLFLPLSQPAFWIVILGLLIITSVIAGSYPALFLSSLNPVKVLKGTLRFNHGASFLRKGLVVFQFSLSIILIVGMLVVYRQIEFVERTNLGYNRQNLIYLPLEGDLIKKFDLFKEEVGNMPGIHAVSRMRESPTVIGHSKNDVWWAGKDPGAETAFSDAAVGYDFIKTMNLQLKEGRDFSEAFKTDSLSYIINETALKKINYINSIGKPFGYGPYKGKIIGVLKDFHFNSMHEAIEPLFLRLDSNPKWGTILIRTEAGKTKEALSSLEKVCKALNPKFSFTYQFSDLEYSKLYRNEQVISKLVSSFAFLAIFISCMGLFGLAIFTVEHRKKEIGVRKVLGAPIINIVALLSINFIKPVSIALFISFPIAWYALNKWLQDFAYKIDIDWWIFALAGFLTISIALLTVSFQSIKAAIANPVKSLRTE